MAPFPLAALFPLAAPFPLAALLVIGAPLSAAAEPPVARVVTVEEGPIIDGRLDDAVWSQAEVFVDLRQVVPVQGAPPSKATEIRLLSDRDHLYLGVRCYDNDPEGIIARKMLRDESLNSEDRISIVIDTFLDRRNGFFFQMNALGARRDGLIEGSALDTEWDGIWMSKARIDGEGWTLEFALPYKTVSFDPKGDRWGFNILRGIRGPAESVRWAAVDQNISFINMAEVGVIEGMVELRQGIGLDVVPNATVRYVDDGVENREFSKWKPGFDAFYKVTPALTGSLTVNTDFGDAEVDDRVVNLSRFEVFFPEKRDFFLQDAGIFGFGGLATNGRPFFSRRVGFNDGGEVPIRAGAKLTGRTGPYNIGLLDVQVGSKGGVHSKNLAVARMSVNVGRESNVGMIATRGDANSNSESWLYGADATYRSSRFRGDKQFNATAWFQKDNRSNTANDQAAFGFQINYPNDVVNANLAFREIQKNFDPGLGFVNRADLRRYTGGVRLRDRRDGRLRTIDTQLDLSFATSTGNSLESGFVEWQAVSLSSDLNDNVTLVGRYRHEDLIEETEIGQGIVPQGSNTWWVAEIRARTSEARPLSVGATVSWGGFFDGRRWRWRPNLIWRPSKHLLISLFYEQNDVTLKSGSFKTRVTQGRFDILFTPDISWNTLVQYDNVSDSIGINTRLRWIFTPGRELFLVFNQSLEDDGGRIRRARSESLVKLAWTFRF